MTTLAMVRPNSLGEEQASYSRIIERALEPRSFRPIAAIEGAAGIGKTVGYLVPALRRAAAGTPVIVSTTSNALVDVILNRDLPLARALTGITASAVPAASRKGIANFVSIRRLEAASGALRLQGRNDDAGQMDALAHAARAVDAAGGTRDLAALLDGQELPAGIDPTDVCLGPDDIDEASPIWQRHTETGASALLIVTNHALLLSSALSAARGRPPAIAQLDARSTRPAIIVDEAHDLEAVARTITDRRVNLARVAAGAEQACEALGQSRDVLIGLDRLQALLTGPRWQPWQPVSVGSACHDVRLRLVAELPSIAGTLSNLASRLAALDTPHHPAHRDSDASALRGGFLREEAQTLLRIHAALTSGPSVALAWSPVRREPAIQLVQEQPGLIARHIWRSANPSAVVLTSGTLGGSPPSGMLRTVVPVLDPVRDFRGSLGGVWTKDDHGRIDPARCFRVTPSRHGRLSLALIAPDRPHPIAREATGCNPEWLRDLGAIARVMSERASAGRDRRSVVVLVPSYAEVDPLADLLAAGGCVLPVLAHRRGLATSSLLAQFRRTEAAVLISPALWQGVSLTDQARHFVIARLPFPPPDELRELLLAERLGQEAAGAILFAKARVGALRRTIQGFARAVRGPDDDSVVCVADPRFPLPEPRLRAWLKAHPDRPPSVRPMAGFENAVPVRFRRAWLDAEIIDPIAAQCR